MFKNARASPTCGLFGQVQGLGGRRLGASYFVFNHLSSTPACPGISRLCDTLVYLDNICCFK